MNPARARRTFVPALLIGAGLCGCGDSPAPPPVVPPARPAFSEPATESPLFEDATAAAGLRFVRFDGRVSDERGRIAGGRRMFEWTGGGVAVLDYDLDGFPDLLFTQGREWGPGNAPPASDPDPTAPADRRGRLFRNLDGERYEDVTAAAGLTLTGFGQGAAAGDYNGDGFPDLFICNIGPNRLLRNEGDGTFTDATAAAGIEPNPDGTDWTVSAAIADLNADGLPDIYEANYLTGREVFTKVCTTGDGPPRVCNPNGFAAAPDRLWLNLGDGRFAEVSEPAGLAGADPAGGNDFNSPAGPGLGVVVAELDGRPGVEVFVANDQRPNHLYTGRGDGGGVPRLIESAVPAGAATDGAGESEAGMGVACADIDGDVRPDLFVTNFSTQSNTLYRRESPDDEPLRYTDATRRAGLHEPGFAPLGFGAAFLDFDRDGDEDLIYVNGHIDDFTHRGVPLFMRPALLDNVGAGRFEPIAPATAGPFFQRPALGRALARLDWNADGREEAVVTHLNGPAVLLKNAAPGGTGVSLRLVGTADDRDAVGAAVTVSTDGGTRTNWLTAGDGYACGDEKRLLFGLGDAPPGAKLHVSVRWPGGTTERFAGVTAGGRFLLVQGSGTALSERSLLQEIAEPPRPPGDAG